MTAERSLDWYIDRAKWVHGYKSDAALGRALGINRASMSQWRQGKALPSDQHIEKLANLGAEHPAIALVDLHLWRTKDSDVYKSYETLKRLAQKSMRTPPPPTRAAPIMR